MGTATLVKLDELLWLGRYMERVYQSINMYKMTYDQLIDQDASFYKNECERMGIPDTFDSPQDFAWRIAFDTDRKSTRLNSSHPTTSRMPSSA